MGGVLIRLLALLSLALLGCWDYSKLDFCSRPENCPAMTVPVHHGGWTLITALGETTPVPQSGLPSSGAKVTLSWNPVEVDVGTISSYSVFRAAAPGAEDYASPPLATDIPPAAAAFTDATVVGGVTYYYVIAAVVDGLTVPVTDAPFSEVKVSVPPANMALVHRWSANQEMCGLLQSASDPSNEYRCPYRGPGGDGAYFDVAASFFVDTFETGCNYTVPGCGDDAHGCIGIGAPAAATGMIDDVYYARDTARCFVKTGTSVWTDLNSPSLATKTRALVASNSPGLPPLVQLDQTSSQYTCGAMTAPGIGGKKLLTHRQQVIAAAWSAALDDPTIAALENGMGLSRSPACNANRGDGLTFDDLPSPADPETLPGAASTLVRSLRTGSLSTATCVSRYGIRDLVGNVWEWSSDQLATCSAATHSCAGGASTLDDSNLDWADVHFDGLRGPGGGNVGITTWPFPAETASATRFLIPLGLPLVTMPDIPWDATPIGTGPGQFDPAAFHGDQFAISTDNPNGIPARGSIAGGSWAEGSEEGRFDVDLSRTPMQVQSSIGLRCAVAAE